MKMFNSEYHLYYRIRTKRMVQDLINLMVVVENSEINIKNEIWRSASTAIEMILRPAAVYYRDKDVNLGYALEKFKIEKYYLEDLIEYCEKRDE